MTKQTEITNPEKFADFLVQWAEEPEVNVTRLAKACGLPETTARQVIKRLETKYQPVTEAVTQVTNQSLLKQIDSKLPMLLDGITKEKVKDAQLREIAVAFGVLAEKRQLLRGEPTQILSHEERQNLDKLGPAILKEIKRRGMVVDTDFVEVPSVSVSPPLEIQEAAVSKTAARQASRDNRAKR